jgi:hypothetical protein
VSGYEDVGTAEFSRGNPAVSNSNDIEVKARSEASAFGLELHWPTRARGVRRGRKSRAGNRPVPEIDYGISLFR